MCDGGDKADYRRNIYLHKGRLICDGHDITPRADNYKRGDLDSVVEDVHAMYDGLYWGLIMYI